MAHPLLHVTLENGAVILLKKYSWTWVCDWISDNGEYFAGPKRGRAIDVVEPGRYLIEHCPCGCGDMKINPDLFSKIARVKELPTEMPSFLSPTHEL